MPSNDPLILFYTTVFGKPVDIASIQCEMPGRWTLDKRLASEAAAVVFHLPDYREIGDAYKYPGQYWVAWSMECGQNYKRVTDPKFLQHFDITMTHESRSDVWTPYLPMKVVSANESKNTLAEGKVVINKIEYSDGSVWKISGWNFRLPADSLQKLAQGTCSVF